MINVAGTFELLSDQIPSLSSFRRTSFLMFPVYVVQEEGSPSQPGKMKLLIILDTTHQCITWDSWTRNTRQWTWAVSPCVCLPHPLPRGQSSHPIHITQLEHTRTMLDTWSKDSHWTTCPTVHNTPCGKVFKPLLSDALHQEHAWSMRKPSEHDRPKRS